MIGLYYAITLEDMHLYFSLFPENCIGPIPCPSKHLVKYAKLFKDRGMFRLYLQQTVFVASYHFINSLSIDLLRIYFEERPKDLVIDAAFIQESSILRWGVLLDCGAAMHYYDRRMKCSILSQIKTKTQLDFLVSRGFDINHKFGMHDNFFINDVKNDCDFIEYAVKTHGADINLKDRSGRNVLDNTKNIDCMILLHKLGATRADDVFNYRFKDFVQHRKRGLDYFIEQKIPMQLKTMRSLRNIDIIFRLFNGGYEVIKSGVLSYLEIYALRTMNLMIQMGFDFLKYNSYQRNISTISCFKKLISLYGTAIDSSRVQPLALQRLGFKMGLHLSYNRISEKNIKMRNEWYNYSNKYVPYVQMYRFSNVPKTICQQIAEYVSGPLDFEKSKIKFFWNPEAIAKRKKRKRNKKLSDSTRKRARKK